MNAARGGRGALLGFAILLSGFASLTYQIVWVRRFAVVLGTTNAAVTVVLAMFLGGLGLGAILAARSGGRLGAARLARRFLVLELGAAGFAAGLPLYLAGTVPLVRAAATPESALAPTAMLAALFLLPAATLMGATLPTLTALSRRVRDRGEAGAAGWLYAANTGGALIGSVAAARILIPELGLTGSSACGIGANLAAGIDVNDRAFEALKRSASPYVRHRIASIQGFMARGAGLGRSMVLAGHGFPDPSLVPVVAALDGAPGWERKLARFVERWVGRSEELLRARAAALNGALLMVVAGVMGSGIDAMFSILELAAGR